MPTLPAASTPSPWLSTKPIILWFHDPGVVFTQDAVINPDHFPNIRDGQLLRIHFPRSGSHPSVPLPGTTSPQQAGSSQPPPFSLSQFEREPLIVKAACVDRELLVRQQHLQISVSRDIAERFNIRFRPEVYVELIDPGPVTLTHVELWFKEQYLGRSDMWRLQQSLKGACVYIEKKLVFAGAIKATAKKLYNDDRERILQVSSGYINDSTRMIFRSGSAKYFVYIQMSREMWEFDEDGELYFEKVVNNFLPQLFQRWKDMGTNHVVSIVLFTRVFYDADDPLDDMVNKGEDGRFYKDFYKVLADWETTDDWMCIIGPLKKEQLKFQQQVLTRTDDGRTIVCGRMGMAFEGNLLEAVNLALNPFEKHYVDRDLMRTGLSIILITPGAGKFTVNKKLLRLTNERMTDNGIAMDLVCLSPLPLHITPLLFYASSAIPNDIENCVTPRYPKNTMANSPDKKAAAKEVVNELDPLYRDDPGEMTQMYCSIPHWIDCSFYHHETGRFLKQDKFKTRCKMYELQMMGIMEHDIATTSVPSLTDQFPQPRNSKAIRQQRSSSSLNDKLTLRSEEHAAFSAAPVEGYLSRSANFPSNPRSSSYLAASENISSPKAILPSSTDYSTYDSMVFKDSLEPRFNRGIPPIKLHSIPKQTPSGTHRNSFDGPDRQESDQWQINNSRAFPIKSSTAWNNGDQRRLTSIMSQSQQANGKITFNSPVRRDDQVTKGSESFKGSPTLAREDVYTRSQSTRRGTINSNDTKFANPIDFVQKNDRLLVPEDDDSVLVSLSTVEPVPINNKGFGRMDGRKTTSGGHSPRQLIISGSMPSIHKQSANSDIRTSIGGIGPSRSSPHNTNRPTNSRIILINPCNPADHAMAFTSYLRRWQHALPKAEKHDGPVVYWKSLSNPACLPLTTDYFPSAEERGKLYNTFMYTVSASEGANLYQAGDETLSERKKTENILTEMLSQRLAQGFQIIVDSTSSETHSKKSGAENQAKDKETGMTTGSNGHNNTKTSMGSLQDDPERSKWNQKVYWLSMGHQIHQISFDLSHQNVEVCRYARKISFGVEKVVYTCVIWPKHLPSYRPKSVTFNYPSASYGWNYLDHLVAGYLQGLTDNLRFWRARFIIIPREQLPANVMVPGMSHDYLDDEEKRLALFDTWLQNIRKVRWWTPKEKEKMQQKRKKELCISDFGPKFTTMDSSAYLTSEAANSDDNPMGENLVSQHNSLLSSIGNLGQPLGLSKDSKSKDIVIAMRDFKEGLSIKDRRWHFRMFRNAFVGCECVDWLVSQFDDISTREEAVAFGNSLMARKPPLFVSSTGRHGFLDGHYFYRLHDEFTPGLQKAWFLNNSTQSSRRSTATSLATQHSGGKDSKESSNSNEKTGARPSVNVTEERSTFEMSRSMIIDVDPYKKSERRETAILHYDTLHNPKNCYHLQINWLGCTAQLIQELLQNWSRQADRLGLKIVEGSVEQAYTESENNNPFQCPVPISFAVAPPPVSEINPKYEVPDQFYAIALVRHMGFVLDVEADSRFERAKAEGIDVKYSYVKEPYKYDQYIHRSGVAFVQIRPGNQGFFWVNNRLYTNHTPALVARRRAETSTLMHPDVLRTTFQARCNDRAWLTEFFETTRTQIVQPIEHEDGLGSWVLENVRAIDDLVAQDTEHDAVLDPTSPTTAVASGTLSVPSVTASQSSTTSTTLKAATTTTTTTATSTTADATGSTSSSTVIIGPSSAPTTVPLSTGMPPGPNSTVITDESHGGPSSLGAVAVAHFSTPPTSI
ncbi:hypothetical protein CLU79DRAFT_830598 [Phycomyces nitens]|nr:hypothetical protein CLU79DRAFT_830598 [Phycomyces nitens]